MIGVVATRPDGPVSGRVEVATPFRAAARVEGSWDRPKPRLRVRPAEPATVNPTSFVVADAIGPSVPLFAAPGRADPVARRLDNPTWEGLSVVFLVEESRPGWHKVRVSTRPNGTVAWVRASDVSLRRVANWIRIEVGARRLTVLHGDTPLLTAAVAVGRSGTPTPVGRFFVDGRVRLDPPSRAYGAAQLSVSGFSPTLESFGGGVGQIALHGTSAPGLLGQAVSNGCVRLDNASVLRVLDLAPTGTPVEIVA